MAENLQTDAKYQIDPSSALGQLIVLGRYILVTGGSFALGKGWISGEALQFLTGLIAVAAPAGWAIYKTYTDKQRLVEIAHAADDSVAVVTPSKT